MVQKRTTAKHGITPHELRRAAGGTKTMLDALSEIELSEADIFAAVIGDEVKRLPSAEARAAFSKVTSHIVKLQTRQGLPTYWLAIDEMTGGLHRNLLFIGTVGIAKKIAAAFEPYFLNGYGGRGHAVQWADDPLGFTDYCVWKEATQQAHVAFGKTPVEGTYPMEGGGDRVSLSPALKRASIQSGDVQPWLRTNNSAKPVTQDKRRTRHAAAALSQRGRTVVAIEPTKAPENRLKEVGQGWLFPDLAKPIGRLRDFHAGRIPPSVGIEVEYLRRRRGFTQRQLASLAGISQPTFANAIRGHDGLSRRAAERLKMALRSA